jgi:DNA recombination protein RmuC
MENIVIVLLLVLLGAAGAVILTNGRRTIPDNVPTELSEMRAEVQRLVERVSNDSLHLSQRLEGIDSRMTNTQTASADISARIFDTLGDVRQATSSVAEQARQFTSLQDLLKAPKARGGIGEAMLEEMLRQVLPPSGYTTQHRFSSGLVVDAAVRAGGRLVCIDSKFPLTNFQRICEAGDDVSRAEAERAFAADVEKHIRDIGCRYIVPDEGTLDFAVMYVPAEGVYAEVLRLAHRKQPLFETAIASRVVPMSPLTMYGYLQTVMYGLKCFQIEKNAEKILDFCGRLEQDVLRFAEEYEVMGKHLGNAHSRFEEGKRKLDRFRGNLERVAELADDSSDRPALEAVND